MSGNDHDDAASQKRTRLVDILLLRIIAAHAPSKPCETNDERLKQAKAALFGDKPGLGRATMDDDKALFLIAQAHLSGHWPSLMHDLQAAASRLKGKAYDREAPDTPKAKSQRAAIMEVIENADLGEGAKHSYEAAYRRIKKKLDNQALSLGDLLEIEQIEEGMHEGLQVIEQILELLGRLGVEVGQNRPR